MKSYPLEFPHRRGGLILAKWIGFQTIKNNELKHLFIIEEMVSLVIGIKEFCKLEPVFLTSQKLLVWIGKS
jgi:hypothetical protein